VYKNFTKSIYEIRSVKEGINTIIYMIKKKPSNIDEKGEEIQLEDHIVMKKQLNSSPIVIDTTLPTFALTAEQRKNQIEERDILKSIGRELDEQGIISKGKSEFCNSEIFTGTLYDEGSQKKITEDYRILKIGLEYYILEETLNKLWPKTFVRQTNGEIKLEVLQYNKFHSFHF